MLGSGERRGHHSLRLLVPVEPAPPRLRTDPQPRLCPVAIEAEVRKKLGDLEPTLLRTKCRTTQVKGSAWHCKRRRTSMEVLTDSLDGVCLAHSSSLDCLNPLTSQESSVWEKEHVVYSGFGNCFAEYDEKDEEEDGESLDSM